MRTALQVMPIEGTNLVLLRKTKQKFEVGDIVVLKSGGTKMTVLRCSERSVEASWLLRGRLHSSPFPLNAVKAAAGKR